MNSKEEIVEDILGRTETQVVINLATIIDYADGQLAPSVYRNLEQEFSLNPGQLGMITAIRSLLQAISTPFWGWMADKYSRKKLLALGAALWGVLTILVGLATSYHEILIFRALNGLALAVIIPTSYSLIADYFPENKRGKAFGWIGLTGVLGAIFGTIFATTISGAKPFGISGWRFAFFVIGILSILLSILVLLLAKDPVRGAMDSELKGFAEQISGEYTIQWKQVKKILTNKTFLFILSQGMIGSIPWNAIAFMILWFQYIGFSDFMSAILFAVIAMGAAFGNLFGGYLGDIASRWNKDKGRLIVAQISVFSGIPLSLIMFLVIPRSTDYMFAYLTVGTFTGFMISWVAASTNNPIFGEIVEPEARSTLYSLDRLFEGSVAASGTLIVGYLAEKLFNYVTPGPGGIASLSPEQRMHNIDALAKAMALSTAVPWIFCLLLFTFVYFTYPNDRDRTKEILRERVEKISIICDKCGSKVIPTPEGKCPICGSKIENNKKEV